MANTLTGRVIEVRPTQTMPTKSGVQFSKRELILDCTRYDPYTGERGYENTPCISFVQNNCSLLDNIQAGQVVTVSIDISGRKAPDKDAYYNDVRGYKIEVRQSAQSAPAPMQAPAQPQYPQGYQQPQPSQYPQPGYPQQPYQPGYPQQYPQQPQGYPQADPFAPADPSQSQEPF